MPTPPRNIDGVTNANPTRDGQEPESDERLRDRAKHALERAGNATLNAIKFAVLAVDGVDAAEVIDHSLDDSIPLGEVRVRFSGGKREDVDAVVNSTRAAGVLFQLDPVKEVLISGDLFLIPAVPGPTPASLADFLTRTVNLLNALSIGDPLPLRRIAALAFQVPGFAELAEARLNFRRTDGTSGNVGDPFFIAPTEIIRPDEANLHAITLSNLNVSTKELLPNPNKLRLTLQVRDAADTPVKFRDFSLDLNVTVRAYPVATEDNPVRLNAVTKKVEFRDSTDGTIIITATDVDAFRLALHKPELEFVITSPAFPGLQGITTKNIINP
jgi:hypothetical protein